MRRLLRTAALLVCLTSAGGAFGQGGAPSAEDVKRAASSFDEGKRAFKAEQYAEAAEAFEKADSFAPSHVALDLAIRSRQQADQLDRAATLAALAKSRHSDVADLVKVADAVLAEAKKKLHAVSVTCDEACDVLVGMRIQHGGPMIERVVYVDPGSVKISAGWSDGRTRSESVTAEAGGSSSLSFEAPPVPEEEPEEESEPAVVEPVEREDPRQDAPPKEAGGGLSPAFFWTGVALTAVAGGVTAWSGIDTQNNPGADVVRERCVGLGESCPEYQDGRDRQLRTNVLAGVTAGVGVVTVVLAFVTDWGGGGSDTGESRKTPRTASVEPMIRVDDGALVGAVGRF